MDYGTKFLLLDAYKRNIKYNYPEKSIYKENHDKYVNELIGEGYLEIIDDKVILTEKGNNFLSKRKGIM